MTAAQRAHGSPDPGALDHFVYLRDVTWREYEARLAMRGERSVPRITYLRGVLELTSPSRYHELDIEVIWTSGGLDKLDVYRKLGVREVWIYEHETLRFFRLGNDHFEESARSALLPEVDPELFTRCMREATQAAAVSALRTALRG